MATCEKGLAAEVEELSDGTLLILLVTVCCLHVVMAFVLVLALLTRDVAWRKVARRAHFSLDSASVMSKCSVAGGPPSVCASDKRQRQAPLTMHAAVFSAPSRQLTRSESALLDTECDAVATRAGSVRSAPASSSASRFRTRTSPAGARMLAAAAAPRAG